MDKLGTTSTVRSIHISTHTSLSFDTPNTLIILNTVLTISSANTLITLTKPIIKVNTATINRSIDISHHTFLELSTPYTITLLNTFSTVQIPSTITFDFGSFIFISFFKIDISHQLVLLVLFDMFI